MCSFEDPGRRSWALGKGLRGRRVSVMEGRAGPKAGLAAVRPLATTAPSLPGSPRKPLCSRLCCFVQQKHGSAGSGMGGPGYATALLHSGPVPVQGTRAQEDPEATLPPLLASTGHFCTEAGPPPGELTCSKGGPSMRAQGRQLTGVASSQQLAPSLTPLERPARLGHGHPQGTGTPRAYTGAFSEHKCGWAGSRRRRHQKRVQEGCLPQSVKYRLQGGDEERPREAGGCKPSLSLG